jgi:hypothetical protein
MGSGRSEVTFTNSYGKKIYVAYMRRDFDCQADCGDIWDVLGWINLDPGETESRANPTTNRWYYYYAEASDGAFWAAPTSRKCPTQNSRSARASEWPFPAARHLITT